MGSGAMVLGLSGAGFSRYNWCWPCFLGGLPWGHGDCCFRVWG